MNGKTATLVAGMLNVCWTGGEACRREGKRHMSPAGNAIALGLFLLNLGTAFGAGLYEHRIVVPKWLSRSASGDLRWNADAARQDDTGRRFWVFVTTVPLTVLTLVNLRAALAAEGALRIWWLAGVAAAMADRTSTFAYFIPTMVKLMKADGDASTATALRWSQLNYVRHAFVLVAWLALLRAFSLLFQQPLGR